MTKAQKARISLKRIHHVSSQFDADFNEFCKVFESVFEPEIKNWFTKKIVVKKRNYQTFKNIHDKHCFLHLTDKNGFKSKLESIGYSRYDIYKGHKKIADLLDRIPAHNEVITKINQFNNLWEAQNPL